MATIRLATVFLIAAFADFCFAQSTRRNFEKCNFKGFTCETSKEFPSKIDVIFRCNTSATDDDVTIYLWQFNSPSTITSFTIQDCNRVRLSFTCSGENKPIQWLKVKNVQHLDIIPATVTHNPPQISLENITYIETLPRHTFSQIRYQPYKPGCFNPVNDLEEIFFKNVNIGTIETEAFHSLISMKNFSWYNVSVIKTHVNAIQLTFADGSFGHLKNCTLCVVEPMAFRVTGDGFYITEGKFGDIWASAFNGTIYNFEFSNNSVVNIQSGAISILAKNVYVLENHFQTVESGAFQKISPGLLRDSKKNFGKLLFVYKFSNNFIDSVENGGVKPDLVAYKNVAAEVTYSYNIMQVYLRNSPHDYLRKVNVAWN